MIEFYITDNDQYCSIGCGNGCTKRQYEKAVKKADELCEELGVGWQPHVWENLGWHFLAFKGDCKVHKFSDNRYWADFMAQGRQYEEYGTTAKEALENVFNKIVKNLRDAQSALNNFEFYVK